MSLGKLLELLHDAQQRVDVYSAVRRDNPGVSALCAATASEFLLRAGLLPRRYLWTAQLAAALRRSGWTLCAGAPLLAGAVGPARELLLQPGDLCFSADANGNGAPDHVYFFLRWLDHPAAVAEVVDNYAAHPAPRNVGAPLSWQDAAGRVQRLARTPLQYALRCPAGSASPPAADARIKEAFAVLYEAWPQLTPEQRRMLNALRRAAPFRSRQ